ncbi:MAG: LapA family protein [Rhizobiaceae bacterium]|nr:LapA family protein [Rhizobiaceae bacterium]
MISKILSFLILVPLAIVLVLFCVLNREVVGVTLDPFGTMPQFTFGLPLFILLMGAVILGTVLGGLGTWLTQAHYRRKAWKRKNEVERLRREADDAKERLRVLREEKAAVPAPSTSMALAAPRAA